MSPPFDPAEFAKSAEKNPPKSAGAAPAGRASLLSMVNANSPSLAPDKPRPAAPAGSPSAEYAFNDLDRGWGDLGAPKEPDKLPSVDPSEQGLASADASDPGLASATDEPFAGDEPPTRPGPEEVPAAARPTPLPAVLEPPPKKRTTSARVRAQNAKTEPPPAEQDAPADPEREMRDRFSLGDYTGALAIAETILDKDPRHPEALECADNCRSVLKQMYTARLGPLDRVPIVMVPTEQLRWLSIDHKAGFVLSHIDGVSSLEMILDVSGMPTLEALRILCELAQQRIISFR